MEAALSASDETVSSLLSWGASPDKTADGDTALIFAIQSRCLTTINLLALVTQVNLGGALYWLARDKVELMTEELRKLVERAGQDTEMTIKVLTGAARFGCTNIMDMIAQNTKDHSHFEANEQRIWYEAVTSDHEATVSALLHLLPNPPLEAITLAKERGVPGVVRLLLPDTKVEGEKEREALRDAVIANAAHLLDQIPRDVEFTYNQNMEKLRPLLQDDSLVPYTTLIKQLHLPKAHVNDNDPKMVCPSDCSQKQSCQKIRETLCLAKIIRKKLGEKSKVFKVKDMDKEVKMIGSMSEGSRAFHMDELDIHLSLNQDFAEFSFFDAKEQVLKKRGTPRAAKPGDPESFFNKENIFKGEEYFKHFVASVHSIISTLDLPSEFSMLPLKTSFTPCTRCMTLGKTGRQVMRCRHKSDCEQHKRCRCEEPSKCECLDECGCREYASPSLTWSKVGVVLHLQWREEDGTLFTIDCDLNCPTWPTHTRFNGNINDAAQYLMRERPVGWLEEFSKLEGMTYAASAPHLQISKSWPVKFRLINKDTVLPGQTLLFMRDETLQGQKLYAYVLLKVLKYCTGSSARSYQCKYAVDITFGNKTIERMEEVGAAIKEIIHFKTIRGKFSSVHPDLAAEGITRVEVGEEGLHFIRTTNTGSIHMSLLVQLVIKQQPKQF